MARPKMKKLLRTPKKPKSKTVKSMETFLKRKTEVERENKKRESDFNSSLKKWESLKERVSRS